MRWSWVYDLKSIRKASSDRDRKRSRAAPASTDLLILERDSGHGPVAHLKWLKQPTKRAQKGAKRPGTCFLELCGALCHGISNSSRENQTFTYTYKLYISMLR